MEEMTLEGVSGLHASCQPAEQLAAAASVGTQMDLILCPDLQVASHMEPEWNR